MARRKWRRLSRQVTVFVALTAMIAAGCDRGVDDEPVNTGEQNRADGGIDEMDGVAGESDVIERCGLHVSGEDEADAGLDAGTKLGDTSEAIDGSSMIPDAGDSPMLPEEFTFNSNYQMRFTDFAFEEDSPGYNANTILQGFLDQSEAYPIIVLLHLDNVDPDNGTVDLRGGAGLKVDKQCDPGASECAYQWDPMSPETYREIELNSETGELRGGLEELDFVGTTEFEDGEIEKFTLPIRDIYFSDAYLRSGDDGVTVSGGRVEGYVTREAAEQSKVYINPNSDGVSIAELLHQDGQNPVRYDADGDGEADSWCLSATFSAKETTIVSD